MDKLKDYLYRMNVTLFLDYILYIILLGIMIWTVYVIINFPIKDKLSQIRYRSKLKKTRITHIEKPLDERNTLFRHIYFLLKASNEKNNSTQVNNFIFITLLMLIVVTSFSLWKFNDLVIGLIFGVLVSIIPYMLLQIKLRSTRNTVGNQISNITETLVHAYSATGYNMYEALNHTHVNIQEPELKRVFSRLINDLQTARTDEELRTSIDLFIYTCGNSWSKRLGNIIFKAYVFDENVSNTLLTLQAQIFNTEKMIEQEKSISMDAVYDGFLPIAVFPASIFLAYYVTGPQDWFKLQFGQTWSLFIFIVALIFTIFSIMVSLLLRKPKNDL